MNLTPRPGLGHGGRFDSADGSYAHTYLGQDPSAAIAEAICPDLDPEQSMRIIPAKTVKDRLLSEVEVSGRITVVVLHGAGLTGVGQDSWLTKCAPRDYQLTRQWAAAIRTWVPQARGFVYRCRHDEDRLARMRHTTPDITVHPALRHTGNQLRRDSLANIGLVNDVLAKYNATLHLGTP